MAYTPSMSNGYTQGGGDAPPPNLAVNRFSPAGGYVSQAEFYSLYQRPIPESTALMARHIGYVPFAQYLRALGFTKGVATKTTGHYEDGWKVDTITVGSIVTPSGGAGNNMIIALDSTNMYNTNVTVASSARKASYPIVGDVIEFEGRVQARVITKNVTTDPHRLTLEPLDSTVDLDDFVTAAETYAVLYNVFAEATGIPATRAPRFIKYTNEFGIVKRGWSATGSELTNAVYHEVEAGNPGSAGKSIVWKVKMDTIEDFERAKANFLIHGQTADNLTDTTNQTGLDMTITVTEGFIEFAMNHGGVNEYTVGSLALADYYDITKTYRDQRSSSTDNLLNLVGPDQASELEQEFQQVFVQNLAPFINNYMPGVGTALMEGYQEGIDSNPRDAFYSAGMNGFRVNGFNFFQKRVDEYNDIRGAGLDTYGYRNFSHIMPYSYFNNAVDGSQRGAIGYEYKALDGYSRENVIDTLPGFGVGGENSPFGKSVNEYDVIKGGMLSELALHMACGNAIVSLVPNA